MHLVFTSRYVICISIDTDECKYTHHMHIEKVEGQGFSGPTSEISDKTNKVASLYVLGAIL